MTYYIFKDGINRNITIGKLVCLARTYKKHAQEMNSDIPKEPILFLKPSSAIIFNGDTIQIPKMSKSIHHEVELAIIIGKKCKDIEEKDAHDYILGYAIALDITARDIQTELKKKGWPWGIAKGFNTFAPISEVIIKENLSNPQNIDISLKVNGKIKQKSNTKNMIFSIGEIIEYISKIMTLEAGDLIMTGTPEGVGEIKSGDILEANLGNLLSLKVNVN
jgi:2-keto-4-pentenoate hydratase/2-oxohepta-3-ene-1,7-dioic acid hydratase in catechol pathway